MSQTDDIFQGERSEMVWRITVCSFFAFEIKEGTSGRLEKARLGLDYRLVNKIMCFLES